MRGILIDWLIEITYKFKLVDETLYITVQMIDNYLEENIDNISKDYLQLVGVTCLLLASKYEEVYPPSIKDLVYICADAFTYDHIIQMEQLILYSIDFNINSYLNWLELLEVYTNELFEIVGYKHQSVKHLA